MPSQKDQSRKRLQGLVAHPDEDAMMTVTDLCEIFKRSRSGVYAIMDRYKDTFPKSIKGRKAQRFWEVKDIEDFLRNHYQTTG